MSITVSIVIPAHNAARTIGQTIGSAAAQSLLDIEIIVVDDGSTDETAAIVAGMAAREPRLRLIRQANGGVARARNRGIGEARGRYIAPLDADDIWHPEKLVRQVATLDGAGPEVALAYNWFRRIDEHGDVLPGSPCPRIEGWVYHRHLIWNFISNGSTPLIRADLLRDTLYEPVLRDAGNEGCEDYLMQLRLVRNFAVACVPAFLTGYRQIAGAMSRNVARMLRSHLQVFRLIEADAPASGRRIICEEIARYHVELARNRLRRHDLLEAMREMLNGFGASPRQTAITAWRELGLARKRLETASATSGRPFSSYAAEECDGVWKTRRAEQLLAKLTNLDLHYAATLSRPPPSCPTPPPISR